MNILEINKFYYNRRGAEKHMLDVMKLLESKGDDVAVFSMQHPENFKTPWEKYFVSYVGYNATDSTTWQKIKGIGRMAWSFEARTQIKHMLQEFHPDIVHIHNIYHQISPSILAPLKQSGAKIIMTVHDYNLISPDKDAYYNDVNIQYWKFLSYQKYSFMKRFFLVVKMYWEQFHKAYEKNVDAYIVPSAFVKKILADSGMDEKKIHVIPHFISQVAVNTRIQSLEDTDTIKGNDIVASLGLEKYALYFGSISEGKGVSELIALFETLQHPLVLAGTLENGFVLPESKWVTYIGHQSSEAIKSLIQSSEFVVSGSRLPETFGLIALEAIAEGKLFFGMRVGALPEIIDNTNGILADDYDTLRIALQQYLSGGIAHFASSSEIQVKAQEKFGSDAYYTKFIQLSQSL